MSKIADQIEEIDRVLFDAGVLALSANTVAKRKAVDRKIMDARVALVKLEERLK